MFGSIKISCTFAETNLIKMATKKKSNAGRKSLPESEKKVQVKFFIQNKFIPQGTEKAGEDCKYFLENTK